MNASDRQSPLSLELTALSGIPLVRPGDCLVSFILQSLKQTEISLNDGDILVIAQKVVSKSEGRYVRLDNVKPSKKAIELANLTEKDPRLVELILTESHEIVRHRDGVIVVENRQGVVLANAGIDRSNVESDNNSEQVLLLPLNPDESASNIRNKFQKKANVNIAVIINDSIGRAWRNGTIGTSLGVSGLPSILNLRGQPDLFGKPLTSSEVAISDELSSAASLLQGQANEGRPVVLIRGYSFPIPPSAASITSGFSGLIRPKGKDLFR